MPSTYQVSPIDIGILVGYLILSRVIPLWLVRGKVEDSRGFFLGGRNFAWPLIGFSLFATNMSGASFIGLAGAGYSQGVSVYSYEWMAAIILIIFIFFILPFYLRSQVFTLPEFLERRYDRRSRLAFSGVNIFFNMFIDAAAALYAGALVVLVIFPETPLWLAVLVLAGLAGVLSIFGGLAAVVVSDTIQAVVLILGGTIVFFAALNAIPSWDFLVDNVPPGHLSIIQPVDDPNLPWPGLFTGVLIIGIYFWTTNQMMVQRTLGARTLDHGRWGALFAGFLKLPILFLMILPGSMALLLYPDLPSPDLVFPTLVFDLLPIGVRGVILAALVAAITSSVDSILNSASTMVTMDFVRTLRPHTTDRALVRIGRLTTTIALIVAILWAPQIANFPSLWAYLQSVLSYTTPPIVAVFLVGIFWPRANRHGAFATLLVGIGLGLVALVMIEGLGVFRIQFLYAAGISFAGSIALLVLVSLMTAPEPKEKIEGLTWHPDLWRAETEELRGVPWWKNYRFGALALFAATAGMVVWFW
jgi:solute:Na+ symporter, SSS family